MRFVEGRDCVLTFKDAPLPPAILYMVDIQNTAKWSNH